MNLSDIFNRKTILALGAVVSGFILIAKMSPEDAKTVSTRIVDAVKEVGVAYQFLIRQPMFIRKGLKAELGSGRLLGVPLET